MHAFPGQTRAPMWTVKRYRSVGTWLWSSCSVWCKWRCCDNCQSTLVMIPWSSILRTLPSNISSTGRGEYWMKFQEWRKYCLDRLYICVPNFPPPLILQLWKEVLNHLIEKMLIDVLPFLCGAVYRTTPMVRTLIPLLISTLKWWVFWPSRAFSQ